MHPRGFLAGGYAITSAQKSEAKPFYPLTKKKAGLKDLLIPASVLARALNPQVGVPIVLWIAILMVYILTPEVIPSLFELPTGFITATTVLPLFCFGVVVVVFLAVVTLSHG